MAFRRRVRRAVRRVISRGRRRVSVRRGRYSRRSPARRQRVPGTPIKVGYRL